MDISIITIITNTICNIEIGKKAIFLLLYGGAIVPGNVNIIITIIINNQGKPQNLKIPISPFGRHSLDFGSSERI